MSRLLRAPMFPLLQERRAVAYAIIFGIWAEVFLYCLLHDQYLVRIAPEHFTEYHAPLWGIADHSLLAAAWAFRASIGPGLVLGLASLFLARAGSWPQIAPRTLLKIVPVLILLTEACGLLAGWRAWETGSPIYPEAIYPDLTRPILVTQSIQLTCYAAGAVVSFFYLAWIVWHRSSLHKIGGNGGAKARQFSA